MARSGWSGETRSRQERGYGAKWERLRKAILLRDNYLCQCRHCKAAGLLTSAGEVDHIVSKARARALGWTDERADAPSNLQAINSDCHKRKTIEEQGKRVRPLIGIDGWTVHAGEDLKS